MTADLFADSAEVVPAEVLEDGGLWLLDVVAAVDHLRRGYRPGLTVWDAFAEALHWSLDPDGEWATATDPFAEALRLLGSRATGAAEVFQGALRRWVAAMADRYNNGYHWPHPIPRRTFPPPRLDHDTTTPK